MVKGFKEFTEDQEAEKFKIAIEELTPILIFENNDKFSESIAEQILEEGKTYTINKRYSMRHDLSHVPGQKDHLHFMVKGHEIGVINTDKTSSHGTDISKIPNKFIKFAKSQGLIEQTLVENRLYSLEDDLFERIEILLDV